MFVTESALVLPGSYEYVPLLVGATLESSVIVIVNPLTSTLSIVYAVESLPVTLNPPPPVVLAHR